jgi:trigger factor
MGELVKQLADVAALQLRSEYILRAIADAEKIEVTDADIQSQLQEYANAFRRDIGWVRRMFEREGHIASLYEDARERKALDWVVAHAVISEEK